MQRPWRRALAVRLSIHLAFGAALPAQACWDDAAQRYQVSSALLYAIARTESGLNPLAMGIFHFIKQRPSLLELIRRQAHRSKF